MDCGNANDLIYHSSINSTNMVSFLKISTNMVGEMKGMAVKLELSKESRHRRKH